MGCWRVEGKVRAGLATQRAAERFCGYGKPMSCREDRFCTCPRLRVRCGGMKETESRESDSFTSAFRSSKVTS